PKDSPMQPRTDPTTLLRNFVVSGAKTVRRVKVSELKKSLHHRQQQHQQLPYRLSRKAVG
ncbi:hypothetical protein HK104_003200, partial [Borealophlyctis nickersoniae]